jgi:hypothetical protein
MTDTKLSGEVVAPKDLWTLVKQLRVCDLVNAIKQIVLDDFQQLANVSGGRVLNLEPITLRFKELPKTRIGRTYLITITFLVCKIFLNYVNRAVVPFLSALGSTNAGLAAGKTLNS